MSVAVWLVGAARSFTDLVESFLRDIARQRTTPGGVVAVTGKDGES